MTKQRPEVGELTLADLPDIVNVAQAAEATHLSQHTIRSACKRGALKSFIPGSRPAATPGRGMGYRIHKAELQAWFFGIKRGEA